MKKRVLALLLSSVLAAGLLMTGCGGDSSSAEATQEETAAAEETAETEETDAEAASGQITFSDLQDNYAALTEAYNAVVDAYNDNSIAQSDEIDQNLSDAKDLMDQMGELSEDDFKSQEDLETINNSMLQMCDILNAILDKMEPAN